MRMNMWITEGMSFGSDLAVLTHRHTLSLTSLGCILSESVPMCAGNCHSCQVIRLLGGFIIDC